MIVQVLSDLDGCLLAVSEPQDTSVYRPCRKRPGHTEHTPADQVWNHSISSLRVAVEHAIGHWKNWKILATDYHGRHTELPNLIRIVTTLEHYRLNW